MSRYNTFVYDDDFYDMPYLEPKLYKRSFHRVPLGPIVHRTIGKKLTFRGRHGNGYYGSVLSQLYFDKFFYTNPWPNGNPAAGAARSALTTAVSNWKNVLTDQQKAAYHKRAVKRGQMSGYNLYVGEYVKANA